ncbi:putative bifunctional UDP-N-acetylmuramoyl-tripeptide:D-alanyl-D-alanine ligase/alanine racemase [Nitritalea halalkaliphila LW7]|uniref:Alanine racemase n=1 Tax=Nitritalea halalkaliphila LW7 TaxID=1189621 RepID=I5BVN5_9BACT|nr:bifunctional UDP-N-acetylmuramoyl-tripeptide:D-alanyl-D-alanine ligase/alanine racemase [Nitritalea halalkaliphila]EIM73637.1 putative bifunctional UDP-N-acetylmuramoyl-tripeptide:D-alanyl-D-alanine ligase/alanine racemase [Nitritalea halalkaliphila LW7]
MIYAFRPLELVDLCAGALHSLLPTEQVELLSIESLSIDSREAYLGAGQLFICLRGAKFDGHAYVPELYARGLRHFLVRREQVPPLSAYPEAIFYAVQDTVAALQALAAAQRSAFQRPLLAVTGSNGKTIVKEWLGQVLSEQFAVAKSPKSYNSQVGVPLSLFGLAPYHQVALMEAGISQVGEMERLEEMLRPDIGIFTNIGTAHDAGFRDREEKLREKLKLFQRSRLIIARADQPAVRAALLSSYPRERLVLWSDAPGEDYCLGVKLRDGQAQILLLKPDMSMFTFRVRFTDPASLENVRAVIVAALTVGMAPATIQQGLEKLRTVPMRLTVKNGVAGNLLIDDTYNNDLAGLRIALAFMQQQRPMRRKILILSAFKQGGEAEPLYAEVAALLIQHDIHSIYLVGEEAFGLKDLLEHVHCFRTTDELVVHLREQAPFQQDLLLISGARAYRFERIVDALERNIHGTSLEINLNALTHNYNFYKRKLLPDTKVMVMVKAFAYGGGAVEIANHLSYLRADYLAVAYTDEGVALRQAGIRLPIMVLNPLEEAFPLLAEHQLEPVVYSLRFLRELQHFVQQRGVSLQIHLDLDTGMKRLGFEWEDVPALKAQLGAASGLRVASMYTHLVGADGEAHNAFSREQIARFEQMYAALVEDLPNKPLRHVLNSAGILRFPEKQLDMVRLGIGLYGVEVNRMADRELRTVSRLKTVISQIKVLRPEETVGYSRAGSLPNGGRIATIAIGYADGFDRRFSQGVGKVYIHGQLAPVVGNVCMDMCMVDVSHIPEAREGDVVIIFGEELPLIQLAEQIGTIPYELLTAISTRVKRVYYLD